MLQKLLPAVFAALLSQQFVAVGNDTGGFGPRAFSCGQTAGLFRDVWSVQNNPGALGFLPNTAAAVSFERRYSSLSMLSFSAAYKNEKLGNFGLAASRFGPDFFSQSRLGLSWGKSFGIAALGLQAQWYQTSASDIGARHYLLINFGGIARLGDKIHFSGTISNISQTKASKYTDVRLPTIFKAGLSFQPNTSLMLMAEIQKSLDEKAGVNAGLEYLFSKNIAVRTGFSSASSTASFGLGIGWRDFHIDLGSSLHLQLGFSHTIGIQYQFGSFSPGKKPESK